VDSSGPAFEIAASMAFQDGAKRAGLHLLEPVMAVEVVTPEGYMGDVIGDINSRRGKILGRINARQLKSSRLKCHSPRCLVTRPTCGSKTQGRATYTMQFSHYEAVPSSVQEQVVAKIRGN